jgi:hypothetical protein
MISVQIRLIQLHNYSDILSRIYLNILNQFDLAACPGLKNNITPFSNVTGHRRGQFQDVHIESIFRSLVATLGLLYIT